MAERIKHQDERQPGGATMDWSKPIDMKNPQGEAEKATVEALESRRTIQVEFDENGKVIYKKRF